MNPPTIEVRELTKMFGAFTAVDHISFDVAKGEIFGFLGPNGAGKSTTIRMLCGILQPTSGTGRVGGFDIGREPDAVKRVIGYMSQKFTLYGDLTVGENIDFHGGIRRLTKPCWPSAVLVLAHGRPGRTGAVADRELSGGWKQRLALGCSILHHPGILFLDEPTASVRSGLAPRFLGSHLCPGRGGHDGLVTSHYMDEVERCHRTPSSSPGRSRHRHARELKLRYLRPGGSPAGGRLHRRRASRGGPGHEKPHHRAPCAKEAIHIRRIREPLPGHRSASHQLLLFGYAITLEVRHMPIGHQRPGRLGAGRDLVAGSRRPATSSLRGSRPTSAAPSGPWTRHGSASSLVLRRGFARAWPRGRTLRQSRRRQRQQTRPLSPWATFPRSSRPIPKTFSCKGSRPRAER